MPERVRSGHPSPETRMIAGFTRNAGRALVAAVAALAVPTHPCSAETSCDAHEIPAFVLSRVEIVTVTSAPAPVQKPGECR